MSPNIRVYEFCYNPKRLTATTSQINFRSLSNCPFFVMKKELKKSGSSPPFPKACGNCCYYGVEI